MYHVSAFKKQWWMDAPPTQVKEVLGQWDEV